MRTRNFAAALCAAILAISSSSSAAVVLPYENDLSVDTAGIDPITDGSFGTSKSSWSYNNALQRYDVSIIDGNLQNGAVTVDADAASFGGAADVAQDFVIEATLSVVPDNSSEVAGYNGATQLGVWFLGGDQRVSINNKYRLLIETDGSLYLEDRSSSWNTLDSTTFTPMLDGVEGSIDVTILGQYIDTNSDNINDSLLLTGTIDTGMAGGVASVSAIAGPTGATSNIYTDNQVVFQWRDRSQEDMTGALEYVSIRNVPEPATGVVLLLGAAVAAVAWRRR